MSDSQPPAKRSKRSHQRNLTLDSSHDISRGSASNPIKIMDEPTDDLITWEDGSDTDPFAAPSSEDDDVNGLDLYDSDPADDDAGDFLDHGDDLTLEDAEDNSLAVLGQAMLDEDIEEAKALLAHTRLVVQQVANSIEVVLPLDELSDIARAVSGLTSLKPITVRLSVHGGYRRTSPLPVVKVQHEESVTTTERICRDFIIGLQLCKVAQNYLVQRWEKRGEGFLSALAELLADRLANSGNHCLMCDAALPFPGLKPTVCDQSFCSFQLEEMGIGSSLAQFEMDPEVADLLLTLAVSACLDSYRLTVSPIKFPLNGLSGQPYTGDELMQVVNLVPKAQEVLEMGAKRKEKLLELSPHTVPLVSWIFATNRAHITSMPEEDYFPKMASTIEDSTMRQFQIETSTRAHAEKFEALKAAHGSFYAFHGSSMSNWHNILRQNLKNASRTPLMSAGAAYGEGIYLSTQSNVSKSYVYGRLGNAFAMPTAFTTGTAAASKAPSSFSWLNSELGANPVCLALVEVASSSRVHKHLHDTIIVASDESCVMLRYLFVYSSANAIPNVTAAEVVPKRYKNEKTIAFQSTLDEVTASGNLLVTSDGYFWDIEEVVAMVKAKNGLFINGFNQLSFAPEDVRAILNHRTGLGRELKKLERENAKLRTSIPRDLLARLNRHGQSCIRDHSAEFTTATQVIEEVRQLIENTTPAVKEALAKVPFEAIDSHTRRPFRDTITHALEMVTSGGECVHRFGDFLSQVR